MNSNFLIVNNNKRTSNKRKKGVLKDETKQSKGNYTNSTSNNKTRAYRLK